MVDEGDSKFKPTRSAAAPINGTEDGELSALLQGKPVWLNVINVVTVINVITRPRTRNAVAKTICR